MASMPMPNPQASAPQPGGGGASPQGNPPKDMLGKIVQVLHQMATQNATIQDPLNQAVQQLVQAIQVVDQSSPSAPQAAAAPPQQ